MTPEVIAQLVLTVGVVPSLLIFLVYTDQKSRKEEREERKLEREKSQERERQLMEHISKSDEALNQFAGSLAKIGETMNGMDKSMGYLQRDVEELKAK